MAFLNKMSALLAALLALTACSTYQNIYTNYDRSIDFNQYSTFAWAPDSTAAGEQQNTPYDNDIVRNNAKNYITHSLTQRGFLVDVDSPDLVLELVLLNEKKERIVTYHTYPYYSGYYFYNPYYFPYYYPHHRYYTWYGWHGWTYHPYWDEVTTYTKTYIKGTVTLNMYDRKLQRLVWTGSAEGNIYDPQYIQYDVHPAIDKILKLFPVKPAHRQKHYDDLYKERIVRGSGANREIGGNSVQ